MNIKQSPTGKIVRAAAGYDSFIPNPLPPQIEWSNLLVGTLSKADQVIGMVAREAARLPDPHLLVRPFIAREAVLSSKIEGTQTTLGEFLAEGAGAESGRAPEDLQEIKNYIYALGYGFKRLHDLPLSLRLIREMHEKLMQGVRGSHARPGQFRTTQNWIGIAGCTVHAAKYVPPVPEELAECLKQFEEFLHNRSLPPLIHIALCHYQFEAIHPFLDGNGRIGRLLITLLLMQHKLLPSPFLYLSAFFEATRDEYYAYLFAISSQGKWNDWFIYFLNGVIIQGLDVISRSERINALVDQWTHQLTNRSDKIAANVVKDLATNPYCSAQKIATHFGVAFTTAQRALAKLEASGIITKVSGSKRDRIYCAQPILAILEEPTKITQEV
jgi:Fic family protein